MLTTLLPSTDTDWYQQAKEAREIKEGGKTMIDFYISPGRLFLQTLCVHVSVINKLVKAVSHLDVLPV